MRLFPAIDLLEGKAVRLKQGKRENRTIYGDPLEIALEWSRCGANYLHVVDLDAAFGTGENTGIVARIVSETGLPVQTGGGIRSFSDIDLRLAQTGATRIIVGTAAVQDKKFLRECGKRFGARVAYGIDCKRGKVAVKGWTQLSELTAEAFALEIKACGGDTVIFTDIARDGCLQGVNLEATENLQRRTGLNVIASGGVRDLSDIRALKTAGVYGAVLGKSLYEKTIDLREAVCLERE